MSFSFSPIMPNTANDLRANERTAESVRRAAKAAGNEGKDSESQGASNEKDADGRQAWMWNRKQRQQENEPEHKVQDLSGKIGSALDLDG